MFAENVENQISILKSSDMSGEEKIRAFLPDLANQLAETPQDPRWHSEGNVLRHTGMVLDALLEGSRFSRLNSQAENATLLAAVLHDCAKPERTRHEIDGSITSHHHASAGDIKARGLLYRSGVSPVLREMVCNMVAQHHKPAWIVRLENVNLMRLISAISGPMEPLIALCLADATGRTTINPDHRQEAMEWVELFEIMSMEHGVFNMEPKFKDNHSRFMFCQDPEKWHFDTPVYDDYRGGMTIVSGLPGSGKSTWIEMNAAGRPIVSLDDLRRQLKRTDGAVIQEAIRLAKQYMASETPFIWNSTNLTNNERSRLLELALNYRTYVEIVAIETPYRDLVKRNNTRPFSDMMPFDVIEGMIGKWQFPKTTEAHLFSWIDGTTMKPIMTRGYENMPSIEMAR